MSPPKPPWSYEIDPTLGYGARIILTDGVFVDAAWEYESLVQAIQAFLMWAIHDFEGEPDGWRRAYPPYFRRRPDGDPNREEIRP